MKTIAKKVLSCLVVIGFLMSAVPAVVAEDASNSIVGSKDIQENFYAEEFKSQATATNSLSKVVYGFWPHWEDSQSYQPDWDGLTHVSYFSMDANSDGTLDTSHIGADYYNVRNTAHSHDVKVTLTVTTHDHDKQDYDHILAYHRNDLANNVLQKVQAYGAEGVSIDFEGVSSTNSYTGGSNIVLMEQFMQVLYNTLKNADPNYHISFCVMGSVESVYRNAALSQYTDAVLLMGYDYHWKTVTITGANSPYNYPDPNKLDVDYSVENILENYYPSNKIILLVPFYGWDWRCESNSPGSNTIGAGTAVNMGNAIVKAQNTPDGRLWDPNSHTPWYRYQSGGTWHQCWYEDEESLGLKFDYVNSANIGGTGFWALGKEGNDADIWKVVKKKFTSIGLSVPFYSQRDDRWGDDLLGQWGPTIKKEGCALTSVAMVMAYYGAIIDNAIANPKNLNLPEHFEELNGHAILKWDAVNETCHSEKNELEWIGWKSVDWKEIDRELENNYPVIVDVSCKYGQHFIVFCGKLGDEYLFYDPYDEVKTEHRWTEGSETGNGASELGEYAINSLRIYHGVSPIEKGLQYLRNHQNPDGSWTGLYGKNVGYTSLAALAFLNHGVDESDPTVSKAINYILSNRHADGSIYVSYSNYETALAILPLVATHNSDYDDEIAAARDFLVDIQIDEGEGRTNSDWPYGGWGYGWGDPTWADLSNTQWTMMGLDAADLTKTEDTWSKAVTFVTRCQNLNTNPWHHSNDGGFGYQPPTVSCCGRHISYGSMTAAGIWGLRLADVSTGDQRVQAGLNWLRDNYAPIETKGNCNSPEGSNWMLYYHLLGFAKTLIMTGIPTGSWQETASQDITNYILSQQYDDGHWSSSEGDIFATEQAILALQTRIIPTDIQRISYLTFILHSNADLHIYDPLGRHVGKNYDTGEIEIQILNATYTSNGAQNITIPGLETGNYRIVLIGTGTGEYTLNVTGGVGNDTVSEDSYTATISEGEVHDSTVNVAMITWLTIHVDAPEPIDPIVPSATGTGNVSFIADAGTIVNLTALNETDLPAENPNVDFPHGLFSFNITGLDPEQTVNITIAFPQDIPATAQYWKYHTPEGWYLIPMGSNDGDNIITITLQDGGMGDDDGDANGVIVDQGGPGIPVAAPNITSFAPLSPVNDTVCNWRTFNITVNQTVNVSWYVNGSLLSTNHSVTEANYTIHADVVRVLNVTAIAANINGTDKQTWIWNVTGTCAPIGGFSVAILPKLKPANAGEACDFRVRLRNTQNFVEYVDLDLTLSGIPAEYAANLTGFNWTTSSLSIPAGEYRDIGLRMDIPDGISGYKSFGIIAQGTFGDSKDYGVVNVTLAP